MTTMSNYPTTDYMALPSAAKTSGRAEEASRPTPQALARAEEARAESLAHSQVVAALCFFLAAVLAVMAPERSAGFMVAFLATALVASASRKWRASRRYKQEIARAMGGEKNLPNHATGALVASMEE